MAGSSSVRWWLLLGLGLVLLAVVGALVYGRVAPASPPPIGGAVDGGVTARQAFTAAAELAAQWQEDAGLSVASCHWPAVEVQSGGAVEWNFQFFSPSTQRLALVAADGEAARVVRESLSPYVVPTFSAEAWRVDSDQALQTWWDRGGGRWVARRPDIDLAMQLRMPDDGDDDPVWTVVGLVVGADATFSVRVNATDGTLLEQ
jgi:hypothetical protein